MKSDFFISHASEDKELAARPLAEELVNRDYRVWFDEYALKIGDSLSREIDKGLANCHYGIVILSHYFFAKEWPQRELQGLSAREVKGHKVIIPIWHNISYDEVLAVSPILADKLAASTKVGFITLANSIEQVLWSSTEDGTSLDSPALLLRGFPYTEPRKDTVEKFRAMTDEDKVRFLRAFDKRLLSRDETKKEDVVNLLENGRTLIEALFYFEKNEFIRKGISTRMGNIYASQVFMEKAEIGYYKIRDLYHVDY